MTQIALRALILAEHAGMSNLDRTPAQQAITDLVARQDPSGIWIEPTVKDEYGQSIEPTTWAVFAMKSAKGAGLKVDPQAMSRAEASLESQQRYVMTRQTGPNAALLTSSLANQRLFLGGKFSDEPVKQLTRNLLDHKPNIQGKSIGKEIIDWYQGSVATFTDQGKWSEWHPTLREELMTHQVKNGDHTGSWNVRQYSDHTFKWGRIGVTSMATACLEIYARYRSFQATQHEAPRAPDSSPPAEF